MSSDTQGMSSTTETYRVRLVDIEAPNVSFAAWDVQVEVDEDCHEEHLGRYIGVCADADNIPLRSELDAVANDANLSTRLRAYTIEEDGLTIVSARHISHYSARSVQEAVERDAHEAFRLKTETA